MGLFPSRVVMRAAPAGAALLLAAAAAPAQSGLAPAPLAGVVDDAAPAAAPARAGSDENRARRVVRIFDFEEPDNPDPIPRDWFRAQEIPTRPRPGFPVYNEARLDRSGGRSGGSAALLPVKGGSNSLRLMPGAIPVLPFGDYAITAWVRTEGLSHARAFLAVRFLDERGEPLPGTEVRTEPIKTNAAPGESGAWRPVSLRLAGRRADAAYLQIDFELLQPDQFRPAGFLGDARVMLEDVEARAWLDDLVVYQLPRIELTTDGAGGASVGPRPPELRITVRDLVGQGLRAAVTVRDIDGRIVASADSAVRADGEPWRWRPALDRYGWYTADLEVSAAGFGTGDDEDAAAKIGATRMQFAWLAPDQDGAEAAHADADARRFGIIADRIPESDLPLLPDLLDAADASFVHLWAWRPEDPAAPEEAASRRRLAIDELTARGHDVTMVLTNIPDSIASRTRADPDDPLMLARMNEADWTAYLNPLLERYGQRIRRWNIVAARGGWDEEDDLGRSRGVLGGRSMWMRDHRADLLVFDRLIRRLAPGPMIGMAWRADWALPPELLAARTDPVPAFVPSQPPTPGSPVLDAVTMTYPAWLPPASIQLLAEQLRKANAAAALETVRAGDADSSPAYGWPKSGAEPAGRGTAELTLVLNLPSDRTITPRDRVVATMRRAVEFWRAFGGDDVSRVALDHPWTLAGADLGGDGELQIGPELAAWRTLSQRLRGRRILGELTLTPGVRCYFLAASNLSTGALERGALVAWNESAEHEQAMLRFVAGDAPLIVVDAFGNQTPLSGGEADSMRRIAVGDMPIFVEGIDPYIAQFISQFRIDQPFVEAVSALHERELILCNPWPTALEVVYQIRPPRKDEPGEWSVSPRGTERLFIAPGRTERVPISFRFGPAEMSGRQKMEVVFRLRSDREYPPLVLSAPLEIGLSDLDLAPDFILTPTPAGPDVSIIAMLTNTGERPRTLRMEVRAPGQPSQIVHISNLAPGETTRRQFLFPNAAAALSGKSVTIKVEDNDAPIYLRKAVLIP